MPFEQPRPPIIDALPSPPTRAANPRHVLVIEDSLDAVHILVLLLREMGHVVDYAINGYVGLEMARKMKPEFIILDIGLPGLNGYEVCRRIRADAELKDTKVVMLTAYTGEEYREKSRLAGCFVHLIKPVPVKVLETLLSA